MKFLQARGASLVHNSISSYPLDVNKITLPVVGGSYLAEVGKFIIIRVKKIVYTNILSKNKVDEYLTLRI